MDEERLARSIARCVYGPILSRYSLGIYRRNEIYTVHLNSDPVLPIMPVNGPFALVELESSHARCCQIDPMFLGHQIYR